MQKIYATGALHDTDRADFVAENLCRFMDDHHIDQNRGVRFLFFFA